MSFRHTAKTYLCFLSIISVHTDKQPSSPCKETHDQVCDDFIRCHGRQAEQLDFLRHFITFIKSTHDIAGPGYDPSRIQYLTKVAYDNEDIIWSWTVRSREVQAEKRWGRKLRVCSRLSGSLPATIHLLFSHAHCTSGTILCTWHVFFFCTSFSKSSWRPKTR